MQRVDVLIAGAMALAVAASAAAVLTYEEGRGLAEFAVAWSERTVAVDAADGSAPPGEGEAALGFDVRLGNLTAVDLVVRVAGGGPRVAGGAVSVRVEVPGGEPVEEEGTLAAGVDGAAEILVRVPLGDLPAAATLRAASADAALAAAAPPRSDLGVGAWTVRVAFPPGPDAPVGSATTVTLDVEASVFEGRASPVVPEVER